MLRLVGFFVLVFVLLALLREVPVVGSIFAVPFLGFWLTAALLSLVLSKLAVHAVDRGRSNALVRELGAVDTPHNQGKLGLLYLQQGRAKRAVPLLEAAERGEPHKAEWPYRLGLALLGAGRRAEGIEALRRAAAIDEEHAYGEVLLRLAGALTDAKRAPEALEMLARFERNHGPKSESAYRRGLALRAAGRRAEAREAFAESGALAREAPRYQRGDSRKWAVKALLASWR